MRNPDLQIPTYRHIDFSWSVNSSNGVRFASDFGPLGTSWLRKVYSDALDQGFFVHSELFNSKVLFTLEDVESRDGEILKWVFKSQHNIITVFND